MSEVKLKSVRLSFNSLFEAREFKGSRTYNAKFLIQPGSVNHKAVMAAIKEAATEKFGKKADAILEKHKSSNIKGQYKAIA